MKCSKEGMKWEGMKWEGMKWEGHLEDIMMS